ncbi:thioredoxin TrxC [Vibrio sp. S11_S32]|uniref:thioredoxin TrxC n=1 Tax=Vibrio sp. S11_S32 TaxID=2720225 RepID=UPI0016813CDC|nr:thioredoxin TrxC [Vibrio sp. S11_S32]MBD1576611.1 thioredoxin TrxC [Vibrio sp. S11_S32]
MTTFTSPCPHCQSNNKLPLERVSDNATCGRCKQPLFDGKPITASSSNIEALLQSKQPIVIDFWAPWCNPCVGFAPVFEQTAQAFEGQVRFVKVDTEAQQNIAASYQIRSIPTIMVFKGGKRVDSINGALPPAQFKQWLEQALQK